MIIGIDLDGVVYDVLDLWMNNYNEKTGDNIDWRSQDEPGLHLFTKLPPNESAPIIYGSEVITDEVMLKSPPYPGAIEKINQWIEEDHYILFITSTFMHNRVARMKRLIQDFGILEYPKNYDVLFTELKHLVRCDVFIDDMYLNVLNYRKHNPKSKIFLINQPWNKKYDFYPRADSLADIDLNEIFHSDD